MPRLEPTYTIEQLQAEVSAKFELASFTRDDAVRLGQTTSAVIAEWERNLCCDVYVVPSPGAIPELCYRTQTGTTSEHSGSVIKG